ncbi:MAG: type IV secretion system protein [Steroidobacteraceae bacterium]
MGFFEEFNLWLSATLQTFISSNTALIANILEPAVVALGVLYVILWGYLQLAGKVEEPFLEGVKRLLTLAFILGISLQGWLYNEVIVDTMFRAPIQLASGIIGAAGTPEAVSGDTVDIIDEILFDGDDAASLLLTKGEVFGENIVYYFAAFAVYLAVGITAIYTMFLLALSKIALSVLIAMGPIFLAMLFFESTKRFFEAWMAQLSNYAFLTVLAVLVASLMLQIISTAAEAAVAAGDGIEIAHALKVCIASALTFLIMMQVPAMAQGLASGVALSSFGAISNTLRAGMGMARGSGRRLKDFSRGAFVDKDTSRWDSLSRKVGQRLIGARMPRELRPRQGTLSVVRRT